MTIKNIVLIALSSLVLTACGNKTLYSAYQTTDLMGWDIDSVVRFTIPITDQINAYDVILHVRHTDDYPYQNMWMFVNEGTKTDTIEFYLANDRGQWLGNGHSFIDMPILYREQVIFTDSVYTICIQQGMRETALKGVSDIGVEIVSSRDGKR